MFVPYIADDLLTLVLIEVIEKKKQVTTHGGRKNCSSSTYMPRAISASKKYLPILLKVPSFS